MGIAGLGSRALANLAHSYLSVSEIQKAVREAEKASGDRYLSDEQRDQVINDALDDFNYKLEVELVAARPDVSVERLVRARENRRALGVLQRAVGVANAPES